MALRQAVLEVGQELRQLVGEVVGHRLAAVALQGVRGHRVGARRPAQPEVDAPGNRPARTLKLSATFSGL